ncbi:MAG: hypothetical protein ACTHNO_06180, partial [Ralstonia sp.]
MTNLRTRRPWAGRGLRARGRMLAGASLALGAAAAWRFVRLAGPGADAAAAGAAGVVLAWLVAASHRRAARALAALDAAIAAMRGGDLSVRAVQVDDAEFDGIARALESMNARMSALVADIRSGAT